jgi:hypothetical protein
MVPMLRSGRGVGDAWRDDGIHTALFHHRTLHQWHLDSDVRPREEVPREAVAYTSFHEGVWWLVNLTERVWHTPDGRVIGRNAPVRLVDGLELAVASRNDDAPGRTWRIAMRTA